MRQAHYWEAQEKRWYDQWVESEKTLDEMERAISELEIIALNNIFDEAVKDQVRKLVDAVWRGKR
jgi:mevalonate pyrophosphate decarboxylase